MLDEFIIERGRITLHKAKVVNMILHVKVTDHVRVELKLGVVVNSAVHALRLLLDRNLLIRHVDKSIPLEHLYIRRQCGKVGLYGSVDNRLNAVDGG